MRGWNGEVAAARRLNKTTCRQASWRLAPPRARHGEPDHPALDCCALTDICALGGSGSSEHRWVNKCERPGSPLLYGESPEREQCLTAQSDEYSPSRQQSAQHCLCADSFRSRSSRSQTLQPLSTPLPTSTSLRAFRRQLKFLFPERIGSGLSDLRRCLAAADRRCQDLGPSRCLQRQFPLGCCLIPSILSFRGSAPTRHTADCGRASIALVTDAKRSDAAGDSLATSGRSQLRQ